LILGSIFHHFQTSSFSQILILHLSLHIFVIWTYAIIIKVKQLYVIFSKIPY
jgi:hypothetical protein